MNLLLQRFIRHKTHTPGILYELTKKGVYIHAYTLEDPIREVKIPGKTCIPVGSYEINTRRGSPVAKRYDERFSAIRHDGIPWLQDVPDFQWVYFHCGNKAADTEGCILVGSSIDRFGVLHNSRNAYERLYKCFLVERDLGASSNITIINPRSIGW